jgi:DNA invertase Pin-like site-specific DNA recombinase
LSARHEARLREGEGRQFGRKPKLTTHQRRAAQKRLTAGETQRSIARTFNVGQATISRLSADDVAPP